LVRAAKDRQDASYRRGRLPGGEKPSFIEAEIVAGDVERIPAESLHVPEKRNEVVGVGVSAVRGGKPVAHPRHESGSRIGVASAGKNLGEKRRHFFLGRQVGGRANDASFLDADDGRGLVDDTNLPVNPSIVKHITLDG
jgi:hypothetical protein